MSQTENLLFRTYRKTAHPRSANDGQGWQETEIVDTLNTNDNTDGHTPTLISQGVYDASRRHNYEPFGDICETVQAHYGTGGVIFRWLIIARW